MKELIPSKNKLKEYSLFELIHFRYTMNSKEFPELYQLLISEINERKGSKHYYDYYRLRNTVSFKTILNKSKVFNSINNAREKNLFGLLIAIFMSPFILIFTTIRLFLFTLNNYYEDGKYSKGIAYFSSITAIMALVFMNLITLFTLLNFDIKFIVLWNLNASESFQRLQIFLYYLPFYFIIKFIFPEQKVINFNYDDSIIYLGKILTVCYFILSFIFLVIVSIAKNG